MKVHSILIRSLPMALLGVLCSFTAFASGMNVGRVSLDAILTAGDNTNQGARFGRVSIDIDTVFIDTSGTTDMTFTDSSNIAVTLSTLNSAGGETNTMSNLGTGARIFFQKVGVDFEILTLVSGDNITMTVDATTIEIGVPSMASPDISGIFEILTDTNAVASSGITIILGAYSIDVVSTTGSDGDSTLQRSQSGLEFVGDRLTVIRGCANDEIIKWDEGSDDWGCEADADSGGGGNGPGSAPKSIFYWDAADLIPISPDAVAIAPVSRDVGTNISILTRAYDDTSDECAGGSFIVPLSSDTAGTVNFRTIWYPVSASTNNVIWDFRHLAIIEGENWDQALTIEASPADAGDSVQDEVTVTTWAETFTNLGWASADAVTFYFCRDATADNLVGDALLIGCGLEIPLVP